MAASSVEMGEGIGGGAGGRRWWAFAALGVLALVIMAERLHTYDEPLERDITTYAVITHELANGRELYSDMWEFHPPAQYVTYGIAEKLAGYGYGEIYLLWVAATIATLAGVYWAASRFGGRTAGIWAAVFWTVICADLRLQANQPNTEVFINALMVWAFALMVRARTGWAGWKNAAIAGALFAIASTYKQVAVVYAGMLCAAHVAFPPEGAVNRRALWGQVALIAGIGAATWGAVIGYFALTGRIEDYFQIGFAFTSSYAGHVWENIYRALKPKHMFNWQAARLVLPLVGMLIVGAWAARARARREEKGAEAGGVSTRSWVMLAAFVAATFLAVALPGRFFRHYYQLWLPVAAICGGVGVASLGWGRGTRGAGYRTGIAGAIVLGVILAQEAPQYRLSAEEWSRAKYRETFVNSQKMGREIAGILKPGETFYELGEETGLYFDSGCRPPSGVMSEVGTGVLVVSDALSEKLTRRLLRDLEKSPPEMYIMTAVRAQKKMGEEEVMEWFGERYRPFPENPERHGFLLYYRVGGELEGRLKGRKDEGG